MERRRDGEVERLGDEEEKKRRGGELELTSTVWRRGREVCLVQAIRGASYLSCLEILMLEIHKYCDYKYLNTQIQVVRNTQ